MPENGKDISHRPYLNSEVMRAATQVYYAVIIIAASIVVSVCATLPRDPVPLDRILEALTGLELLVPFFKICSISAVGIEFSTDLMFLFEETMAEEGTC